MPLRYVYEFFKRSSRHDARRFIYNIIPPAHRFGIFSSRAAQSGRYLPQSSTNDETLVLKVASAKSWEHFTENRGNFPARMMRSGKIPQ